MAILHMAGKKMFSLKFKHRLLILVAVFLFLPASFVGAANYGSGTYNSGYYSSTLPEVPVASPMANTYNTTQLVTLTAASSTYIKYATDGMPADCSSGLTYVGVISVATSTTIYARSCNSYGNSSTASFNYIINPVNSVISSGMPSSWSNKPVVPADGFKITVSGNILSFNAGSDVVKMAISLDNNFSNISLEEYTPTKQINLCSGSCTVYVKFYTEYGVASDIISQQIITNPVGLSITPPIESEDVASDVVSKEPIINQAGSSIITPVEFRDLKLGDRDVMIKTLQQFLNKNGYRLADSGIGSLGNETDYFGSLTFAALTKFQIANKLTSEKGYLGKITQTFIDSFIKSKVDGLTSVSQLAGRILLQVESHGEVWYVNPNDSKRYYMSDGEAAYSIMRNLGIGISNKDLNKISVASDSIDNLAKLDSDSDGYNDKEELQNGYNPNGASKLLIDKNFSNKNKGKIFLQVESHGEAWYVNPDDALRYYLGTPDDAFNVMKKLSLGITNYDLEGISEGEVK